MCWARARETTRTARTAAAIAVCFVVAGLAGCGDDGGGAPAAFVARANELCQALADSYAEGVDDLPDDPADAERIAFIQGTWAPEAIQTYMQVRTLELPTDDAEHLVALLTDAIAEVRVIQGDPATGGNTRRQREVVRDFRRRGLTACGAGFAQDLTKADYVVQAGGICLAFREILDRTDRESGLTGDSDPAELAAFVTNRAVPLLLDEIDQLEGLGYPEGDEDRLEALLIDARAYAARLEAEPALYFVPDDTAEAINDEWIDYGVPACGGE